MCWIEPDDELHERFQAMRMRSQDTLMNTTPSHQDHSGRRGGAPGGGAPPQTPKEAAQVPRRVARTPRELRTPGAHARAIFVRLRIKTLLIIGLLAAITIFAGRAFGLRSPLFMGIDVAVLIGVLLICRLLIPLIDRHDRGASGEEHVGRVLGQLSSRWIVLHDVALGRGNVDHIAIGPPGIFAIETKSHPGPIEIDKIHGALLRQATAQRLQLEGLLRRPVEPLVVFSRAWVDRPLARRRGVRVLPASMLLRYLAGREASIDGASEATLLPEHLRSVHETVLSAVARRRSATCEECSGHPPSAVRRGLTLEISAVRRARLSRRLGWRG